MCNWMVHSEGERHQRIIVSPCCQKHRGDITGGKVKSRKSRKSWKRGLRWFPSLHLCSPPPASPTLAPRVISTILIFPNHWFTIQQATDKKSVKFGNLPQQAFYPPSHPNNFEHLNSRKREILLVKAFHYRSQHVDIWLRIIIIHEWKVNWKHWHICLDGGLGFEVWVHSPGQAITGQTVQLYCNFTLPPSSSSKFFSLKWFLNKKEVFRYMAVQ